MQEKRIQAIQYYISQHAVCSYEELCQYCNASLSSIRRDVNTLADKGLVVKSRGGVKVPQDMLPVNVTIAVTSMGTPFDEEEDAKDRIARKACELVQDGDVILLGSGTTVSHMVKYLGDFQNLTVITNNIDVLQKSYDFPFHVIMLGGMLDRNTMSLTGLQTISQLKELNANKTFMSCDGIAVTMELRIAAMWKQTSSGLRWPSAQNPFCFWTVKSSTGFLCTHLRNWQISLW